MTFTTPLGLLALLAIPAVLALHLFRRRLPPREIAGLFLWRAGQPQASAGRRRTPLRSSASLWLELLFALCAALWLGGLRIGSPASRHLVVVLDDSASMAAVRDGAPVAARIAADLRDRQGGLGGGDRITVLASGPRPRLLLGPAAPAGELDDALRRWRPAQPGHDLEPVLHAALEFAGDGGEVLLCSDRLHDVPPRVQCLAHGAPVPNAAILTARRSAGDAATGPGDELEVTIAGSAGAVATSVVVRAGDAVLAERRVDLTAGPVTLRLRLPADAGVVQCRLAADALAIDDEVFLPPLVERTVRVADLLPEPLRDALHVRRAFAALPGVRFASDPLDCQLVLSPRPGALEPGRIEVVVHAGGEGAATEAWPGPFAVDRGHPWFQPVPLNGVVWVAPSDDVPGRVLVAAGRRVLASLEERDGARRLWLGLDPTRGNFARSPAWPILLHEIVESARAEVPGLERELVLLGQEVSWRKSLRADAPDRRVRLALQRAGAGVPEGGGEREPEGGDAGRLVSFLPALPGLYAVRGEDGRELATVAVRFLDPAESDLAGAASGVTAAAEPRGSGGVEEEGFEQRLLALLLVLLVTADLWATARRSA